MNLKQLSLLVALFILPGTAMADQQTQYNFKGDSNAALLCKYIAQDDTVKLDRKLRRIVSQGAIYSNYQRRSPAVLKDFTCNNTSLVEFASASGSFSSESYLANYGKNNRTNVYVEDVVAAN